MQEKVLRLVLNPADGVVSSQSCKLS